MDFNVDIENLVEQAQEGDKDAFGEIFDLFLTPIYRFVFFRVNTKEDAEDLTEDIFLKAWNSIDSFEKLKKVPFSAWLFQIAKNTVTDYYRTQKTVEEISDEEIDLKAEDKVSGSAEQKFDRKRLKQALKKIPALQAEAVSLKFFSELKNEEIAKVLNKSEGAVRILLSRGLKKLKELLKK